MILPTKHVSTQSSLLGVGAILLRHLDRPQTVTELWERVRIAPEIGTFQRFVLALDLLYALGAVSHQQGHLRRGQ